MVLGPPGCGKTTRLFEHVADLLNGGLLPKRVAFLTFTRAARQVALARLLRLGFGDTEGPWFRTIHSACFKLLELRRDDMLSEERRREFADRYGYQLSDLTEGDLSDPYWEPPRRSADDDLRFVYEWGRNRRLSPERALARCPVEGVSASAFGLFVRRLKAFKSEEGLSDFSDLLEDVLAGELAPDVDVIFVDEAQDLSPLQIAVVETWFETCQQVYVAGDDDQAIYRFQGADPAWLGGLAAQSEPEILTQSHRVPVLVQRLGERIIHRNRDRVPKVYRPRDVVGQVDQLRLNDALDLLIEAPEAFVLVRNRHFLRRVAHELRERLIPYEVEGRGAASPLSDTRVRRAVEVALRLEHAESPSVAAAELDALLRFVPSANGLVPRGVKARVKAAAAPETRQTFTWDEVLGSLGLGGLMDAIAEDPLSVLRMIHPPILAYLRRLVERHGALPTPKAVATTIHGAKGRECDLVVLLSDMTRATQRAYETGSPADREAENRVFYVGVTRAKERLVIVEPMTRRSYDFPSLPGVDELTAEEVRA